MKTSILYRKITYKVGESFCYNHNIPFTMPLHAHEEYELIYFVSGNGKEYIGDMVLDYNSGDLTLIGRNVPHFHLCNSYICNDKMRSSCRILQFPISLFPANLSSTPELSRIAFLLEDSLLGIRFDSKEKINQVLELLDCFECVKGVERVILLYRVLEVLSECSYRRIASSLHSDLSALCINEPIEKIYAYLRTNFNKPIELNKVAAYVGRTTTSVCRFFKKKTGKTIFSVLNEIRIEHACRLLSVSDLSSGQIAYECGFNNLSYFNRVFRMITQHTPSEYRRNLTVKPEDKRF